MGQINPCLKRLFTIFNIFFAIVGGVIIALALLSQVITNAHGGEQLEGRTTGLIILYAVGAITMVISILGAYGALKESKAALIVFLVCMVVGSLFMLRSGIPAAVARPELEELLEERFRKVLPLDSAARDVKDMADKLQESLHCCGLFSYRDWRQDIPDSCLCNQHAEALQECQPVGSVLMKQFVYKKTCFPIISHYVLLIADIMLGVVFTLAVLALLGLALSSLMIHQMRFPTSAPMLLTVPAVFNPQPPKYQELHNPPEYAR